MPVDTFDFAAAAEIHDFLQLEPKIRPDAGEAPEGAHGDVVFENVHFSYPKKPRETVLQGLNLRAEVGKMTALVGPSGSGKSTVLALLLRLYDPQKGHITWAGHDLRDLKPTWLRRRIVCVPQVWLSSCCCNLCWRLLPMLRLVLPPLVVLPLLTRAVLLLLLLPLPLLVLLVLGAQVQMVLLVLLVLLVP